MVGVCGDNRFEIIAKVKEHLIKATNIEMHPEELAQVDNILFRLWQLGYFNHSELENFKNNEIAEMQAQIAKLKERNAELKGMYVHSAREAETYKQFFEKEKTENAELKEVHESDKRSLALIAEKGAELEKKISILLSCKNCPNNKGGYICQKEYEDKCLAQKTQYIKELKEENNYLSEQIQKLKIELDTPESVVLDKLDEAKEIIKLLLGDLRNRSYEPVKDLERAEQFLEELK